MLHYQNGEWLTVTPPVVSDNWELRGVHFTSADEGWAVGQSFVSPYGTGVLLHYQGGIWNSVTPPAVSDRWELSGVHFTSRDEGWTVGYDIANSKGRPTSLSKRELDICRSSCG